MNALPNQAAQDAAADSRQPGRTRIVRPCNFRYAGRLSNENARFLTALNERFALNVTTALDLYLGSSLRVSLVSLEQLGITDYVATIAPENYLLPCSIDIMDASCLIEVDVSLVCPIIDLLLGGSGEPVSNAHELTELDEQVVESVGTLIIKELERTWSSLNVTLTPGHAIKTAMVQQVFPVKEKLVLLMFEMTIGETTGGFNIALPTPFVGFQLRHLKASLSKKGSAARLTRSPTLRERILDSNFVVAADIVDMRVQLKDLINLKPGTVLKSNAAVEKPARLTVGRTEIFEGVPVRVGNRKAVQLTFRTQDPVIAKE